MTYTEKLKQSVRQSGSTLCVGLDPNLDLLPKAVSDSASPPARRVEHFLKRVIEVTTEHCAAYKPNLGFFEALGTEGWKVFENILDFIPENKIVIADAKRGDISSTAEHYAKAYFERFDVDAVTLNPLMGIETLDPFLGYPAKSVYVLALTSNPGADDLLLRNLNNGQTVATHIAGQLSTLQQRSETSIGMVVGATKAEQLQPVVSSFPEAPLLIPGVGKQGGSVADLVEALEGHKGMPLVNSSRSIIYAGNDTKDWDKGVARAAEKLKERLSPLTKRHV